MGKKRVQNPKPFNYRQLKFSLKNNINNNNNNIEWGKSQELQFKLNRGTH